MLIDLSCRRSTMPNGGMTAWVNSVWTPQDDNRIPDRHFLRMECVSVTDRPHTPFFFEAGKNPDRNTNPPSEDRPIFFFVDELSPPQELLLVTLTDLDIDGGQQQPAAMDTPQLLLDHVFFFFLFFLVVEETTAER